MRRFEEPAPDTVPTSTSSKATPAVIAALVALAVGAIAFVAVRTRISPDASTSNVSWDAAGGAPIVTTLQGREVIVGRLRNAGPADETLLGAFDGATLKELWRTGSFGTNAQSNRAMHDAVSGTHVAVSDFHGVVHVLDLETGREQRAVSLTDNVESLCPQPPNRVWVAQIDKRNVMLDLTTGQATESPEPAGCRTDVETPWDLVTPRVRPLPGRTSPPPEPRPLPTPRGFATTAALAADGAVVLFGKKSPGTATPMAIGLDPKTYEERWRTTIPAVDLATVRDSDPFPAKTVTACGKRFVAAYGEGEKKWHVTSLDAISGVRQWDVLLRPIFAVDWIRGMVCSETRVYVVRMSSLDVLDANTGRAVGTIGREQYP